MLFQGDQDIYRGKIHQFSGCFYVVIIRFTEIGNIAINCYVLSTRIWQPSSKACDSVSQLGYYMYFVNFPFFKLDNILFSCPMLQLGAIIYTYKHNCIFMQSKLRSFLSYVFLRQRFHTDKT